MAPAAVVPDLIMITGLARVTAAAWRRNSSAPGMAGAALMILGTLLNKFVIWQNGGKMPVYASLSRLTGYYSEEAIRTADKIHSIGDDSTKFKFLTDYIDIGYSILSIGDLLIHAFVLIILYYVIKEVNNKTSQRSSV